jgi:hypothetical protein
MGLSSVVGVAFAEFEADAPAIIHGHCPLASAITLELVQTDAFQRAQAIELCRNV